MHTQRKYYGAAVAHALHAQYPPPCLKHVLVCLGSKQQSLASMLNLDPNHNLNPQCSILILICNGSGCLALSFKGSRAQLVTLIAAPLPPDSALIFRCSFLGTSLSQMVSQSEYRSDLGTQKAPFWLPFWRPFWVRLQK